ncbi:MAG TPA: MmcQ/YjbR family DNA-binding protein [Flavisolibacter sp.]|nr:MmcQ/YjbR family DNA-binding protein [Flavisolibacter sp.]
MNAETLRAICLALPASTEAIKWGADVVFSVGDKMFCVTSFEEPFKCSFKVANDVFEELSCREGFVPAPYLARAKWVSVSNEAKLSLKEWESFVKGSYDLVVQKITKKQRSGLGI